jgi:phosphatidylinositol alpha-1,6-mannosyltransferase
VESNSKKILVITSEFPPSPGGVGNHAFNLAQALWVNSISVTVLTDEQGADHISIKKFDTQQPFRIVRIKRIFPFFYFFRIKKAFDLVKRNQPDVVLVSGKFSLWVGALLKLRIGVPINCIIHGSEVKLTGLLSRWFTYRSIKAMDGIIAVSTFTRQLLPESFLASISNVVIPNGVDLSELDRDKSKANNKLEGRPALLTIGNVTKRKGQHRVIQSLPLLVATFPQIHYHCIGIPTNRAELEVLATSLRVSNIITFHGKVQDRNEMFELAKTATIFIMLSENQKDGDVEGFGIAILEANALGIPAIGAKGSGIEDAIRQGYNGILVDGDNADEILHAVELIHLDYQMFSAQSIEWARQHSWSTFIEKYISFIFKKK